MEKFDFTIIGAGIVGLSIARMLSERNDVLVVERRVTFGQETSSRNSEVIHSGIYYPEQSLKAVLCVRGSHGLYQLCREKSIPCRKIGKLVLAFNDHESEQIQRIYENGLANGVEDLRLLSPSGVNKFDRRISCAGGLFCPSTGIVDSHRLMSFLEMSAKERGCIFAYGHSFRSAERKGDTYHISLDDPDGNPVKICSGSMINSSGLSSAEVSAAAGRPGYAIYYCKGEYFRITGYRNALSCLVYPAPDTASLGIHTVLDLSGGLKIGPDAEYVDSIDYTVNPGKKERFFNAVKRFMPGLDISNLSEDMSGIRPKLQRPGGPVEDFVIKEEGKDGAPGLVNLIGIESPGLTASCAIAEYVGKIVL